MHSEALWLWMVVYIILMIHQPQHFLLVFIDVLVLPLHRGPPFPGGIPGGRFANKAANKANPGQLWDSSSFSFSDLCLLLSHTSPMTSFLVLPVYSHYLIFIELLNFLFFLSRASFVSRIWFSVFTSYLKGFDTMELCVNWKILLWQ